MRKLFKNILPKNSIKYLSYIRNWNHNLYSLNSELSLKTNYSDFFIWSKDCSRIEFVGENIRALIAGREIEVTHNFRFFSSQGELINNQQFKTKSFFEKIKLQDFNHKYKYSSFTHFVDSETTMEEILNSLGIKNKEEFSELNRGYTVYYPGQRDSSSIVHGNFGGIAKDGTRRSQPNYRKHIYTPVYKLNKEENYDLVFNNPTNIEIKIKVILNNSNKKYLLSIPSLGTRYINISNYTGSVSFESRLSICRALVFKNPAPNELGTFDVFHS